MGQGDENRKALEEQAKEGLQTAIDNKVSFILYSAGNGTLTTSAWNEEIFQVVYLLISGLCKSEGLNAREIINNLLESMEEEEKILNDGVTPCRGSILDGVKKSKGN